MSDLPRPFYIVNFQSGGGRTAERWPKLQSALAARAIDGDFSITERPWHGYEIARQALREGFTTVVAVGGDGTVYEVANAILDEGMAESATLGTIPMGTGKDVAKCLGMDKATKAIRAIAEGATRTIDVGRLESIDNRGAPMVRHFLVEVSAGWVPEVSAAVPRRLKRLGDTAPYIVTALAKTLGDMGRDFVVEIDGEFHDGRYSTISVHNLEYWGGDLLVAPGALPDDGLLDVIRWRDLGRVAIFKAIQGQRSGGTHLDMDGIDHHPAKLVRLASGKKTRLDIDGEFGGYLPATISVIPASLRILAPPA